LDGIPLAIELAAAKLKLVSIQLIAERLDHAFHLLTRGGQAALPRHQTLRATVDWSYELLSERERILFHRLAVFAGSFTLAAVEAVCAGEGLEVEEVPSPFPGGSIAGYILGRGRTESFRMLQIISQYGQEKLKKSGEVERVRERFLEFYLHLAEEAEPKLRGAETAIWLNRLEEEHDNLREALKWAEEAWEVGKSPVPPGEDPGLRLQLRSGVWRGSRIFHGGNGAGWSECWREAGNAFLARANALTGAGTVSRRRTWPGDRYHEQALATIRNRRCRWDRFCFEQSGDAISRSRCI
jgi:hypothetical protein